MSPEIGRAVMADPQPFVEGSQLDTSPQLTVPEGEKGGMVGPGQESIVEEFAKEQEQLQEEEAILGKFKNPAELAKAYAELERKMGQQSSANTEETANPEPETQPDASQDSYTKESASERYGSEAVEALAAKGVDLSEVMRAADSGQDISEHFDALAETFNVSRAVVESYVGKAQGEQSTRGMSDADSSAIINDLGGQEAFNALQQWGRDNMSEAEKTSYNAAVDSGNAEAVRWALKSLQARQGLIQQDTEPQLYGGGEPAGDRQIFQSQQQVLDAMNKRNDRGQRLYDVDEAYRNKVAMILSASPDF